MMAAISRCRPPRVLPQYRAECGMGLPLHGQHAGGVPWHCRSCSSTSTCNSTSTCSSIHLHLHPTPRSSLWQQPTTTLATPSMGLMGRGATPTVGLMSRGATPSVVDCMGRGAASSMELMRRGAALGGTHVGQCPQSAASQHGDGSPAEYSWVERGWAEHLWGSAHSHLPASHQRSADRLHRWLTSLSLGQSARGAVPTVACQPTMG